MGSLLHGCLWYCARILLCVVPSPTQVGTFCFFLPFLVCTFHASDFRQAGFLASLASYSNHYFILGNVSNFDHWQVFFTVCFHSLPVQLIPFLLNSLVEPENSCMFPRTLSLGFLRACLSSLVACFFRLLAPEPGDPCMALARQLRMTQDEEVELKGTTETHL